jgi:hypothetical protein
VNVSFTYDSFDEPALAEIQPESAICESGQLVSFIVSSIIVSSAVVSFGPKVVAESFITFTNYPDSGSAVVIAKLPPFTLQEASDCYPPAETNDVCI